MKKVGIIVLSIIVFVSFIVVAFYVKRYVNYSFYYKDKIQEQIVPLEKRIEILEKRQNMLLRLLKHD